MKFRHISEIHSVPSGDQGKRKKDRGNYGQYFHRFILLNVHLGLIHFTDLQSIFPEKLSVIKKTFRTVGEHGKMPDVCLGKETG